MRDSAQKAVEEARMVLPGIQALFGFQLIAVFNNRFELLTTPLRLTYLVALILIVVSIALIMTPAALDRIAERDQVTRRFVVVASRFLTWAMAPLMLAIGADLYIVGMLVTDSIPFSAALMVAAVALLGSLWFVFPWRRARSPRAHPGRLA